MLIIIITCTRSSLSSAMIKIHIDNLFETPTTGLSNVSEIEHRVVPHNATDYFLLTEYQLSKLKHRFRSNPCIQGKEKELMAKDLGISQCSVLYWFHRHRSLKRHLASQAISRSATVETP